MSGPVSSSGPDVFVGGWAVEARFPGGPPGGAADGPPPAGGGAVVRDRLRVDPSAAGIWRSGPRSRSRRVPDSLAIVAAGPEPGRYTQHYHGPRGVTQLYAMTFADRVWTLVRESADFSSLHFAQRFTGNLSADGNRIDGAWENSLPGSGWELDFELSYVRIA
jgi:hypothetical protein